jgi:hypothetical protein
MSEYVLTHIHTRRQRPQEDLISGLVRAELDGQRLDDEIVGVAALLLIADVPSTSPNGTGSPI